MRGPGCLSMREVSAGDLRYSGAFGFCHGWGGCMIRCIMTVSLKSPLKAVVLAAGLGTRMRPLSDVVPKPLMPLWGIPLIGRALQLLEGWGVREVAINLHHRPDAIREHVDRAVAPDFRVRYSYEPEILGTGGALRPLTDFIAGSPFWLMNADIAAELTPGAFLEEYDRSDAISVVWLDDADGPRTVEMQDGVIGSFRSKRAGSDGTYTFCGLHLLSPRVLDYLPDTPFCSIIDVYEAAVARGERVRGVCPRNAFWADLGTHAAYIDAHREVRRRGESGEPGGRLFDQAAMARSDRAGLIHPASVETDEGLAAILDGMGWRLDKTIVHPLGVRGSSRSFSRIWNGDESAVVMRYSPSRGENRLFAGHARFLAGIGLRVPAVLLDRPADCLCVVEDLGSTSLADACKANAAGRERLYKQVLDGVLLLHGDGTRAAENSGLETEPSFCDGAYRYERELFASYFLAQRPDMTAPKIQRIRRELEQVAERLEEAPTVLLHRDLQSSNIFIVGGEPVFIDFQGMRMGPAVYDLASLLCDPYMSFDTETQQRLLRYYAVRCGEDSRAEELFWWGAVERLCQVLGAYGRLVQAGMTEFGRFVVPALRMLERALDRVGTCRALEQLVRRELMTAAQ